MRKGVVKRCERCGKRFITTSYTHYFCGSAKQKTGCSYLEYREKQKEWMKNNASKIRIYQNTRQRKRLGWPSEEIKTIPAHLGNRYRRLTLKEINNER